MRKINHGVAQHDFFGIFHPCFQSGGMDCSSVADGIGLPHKLINPRTGKCVDAVLVMKRSVYTDDPALDSLSYLLYGADKKIVLNQLMSKYADMVPEIIEVWIFKKE